MTRIKKISIFVIALISIFTISCSDRKDTVHFKGTPSKAYCKGYIAFDDKIHKLSAKAQYKKLKELRALGPESIKPMYSRLIKAYEEKFSKSKSTYSETTLREDSRMIQRYAVQKCDMFKRKSAL